jgi:hypothetical protein
MAIPGLADYDAHSDNFLERLARVERRHDQLTRWAAPISAIALPKLPGVYATRTADLTVTTATLTTVTAISDYLKTDGMVVDAVNGIIETRRSNPADWYHIFAQAQWAASGVGYRRIDLQVRSEATGLWSSLVLSTENPITGATHVQSVSYQDRLTTTENAYRFQVYHTVGSDLVLEQFIISLFLSSSIP